jgi:hypothetical protein
MLGEIRPLEALAQEVRSEPKPRDLLVQILPGPVRKTGVDRPLELEHAFADRAGRGDHDNHHHPLLQEQHLDMTDGGRLDGRCRDQRQQPRQIRQDLSRRLERRLDLSASRGQVERERPRPALEALEQPVHVVPVAGLGGYAPRRRVWMREQAARFELGELAADGRRRDFKTGRLDEPSRARGLPRRYVFLDDAKKDLALTLGELSAHR